MHELFLQRGESKTRHFLHKFLSGDLAQVIDNNVEA
jgi:hypothetical protein